MVHTNCALVQKNEDILIRQSLILDPNILDDVKSVLKLCDTLLQWKGLSPQMLHLNIEHATAQYSPYKRLHELSSSIQDLSPKQALPALIQLFKILVSLSANGHLNSTKDDTLEGVIEILQEVHPLRRFLVLISEHNLYWILERVVDMHTAATDIFAGHLLFHAVHLGLHELVRHLVWSKCPLETLGPFGDLAEDKFFQSGGWKATTALGLSALYRRDVQMVRILLDAGADLHCSHSGYTILSEVMDKWYRTPPSSSEYVLFQYLLDAQVAIHQPHYNSQWSGLVAKALHQNHTNVHKMILESLLRLIPKENHDLCLIFIKTIIDNDSFLWEVAILHKQLWIDTLKRDYLSQLIFRGAFGAAILRSSDKALRVLTEHGTSLSSDFASDIEWIVEERILAENPKMIASLYQHCYTYFTDRSLSSILILALKKGWLNIMWLLKNHCVSLHRRLDTMYQLGMFERDGNCVLHSDAAIMLFSESTGLLDLILEERLTMNKDEVLCVLTALARTEKPELLQLFVQEYEGKSPQSSSLLEMPEFLLAVFALRVQNSKVLRWLIYHGVRFNALNEKLSLGLDDKSWTWAERPWPGFLHSSQVLRSALNKGLLPCRDLLIMCALDCWPHCITKKMRLILRTARNSGNPFSQEDLTYCLTKVLKVLSSVGSCMYCLTPASRPRAWRKHIAAIRLLVKFGAALKASWLQEFLENREGLYDEFVWQALRHSAGPIWSAVTTHNVPLLEKLLKAGFCPDESPTAQHWLESPNPLQEAAKQGNWEMMSLLLLNGADVNTPAQPPYGRTALQYAARNGDLRIVSNLLQLGADINARAADLIGETALGGAAATGRLDIVQILIANNSDLSRLRDDCKKASRMAKDRGHSVIATRLEDHAYNLSKRLGVDHADEIDNLCMCEIKGHPRHPRSCKKSDGTSERHNPWFRERPPACCEQLTSDNRPATEKAR